MQLLLRAGLVALVVVLGTTTKLAAQTSTPTAVATPSATPTVDHFQCYEIHRRALNRADVSLTDEFGPSTVTIKKAKRLCAPANKKGEDPTAPTHPAHLMSYTIKQTDPPFKPIVNIRVKNQFGTTTVRVTKPDRLLVPTAKNLGTVPPPALVNPIDHYKCYRVKEARYSEAGVSVETQFGPMTIDILRPLHLCVPVNKNNEDPTAPNHSPRLMCYKVRGPRPTVAQQISTKNQFGEDTFTFFGPRELCVPSDPPCASAEITLPTELPDQTTCVALPRPPTPTAIDENATPTPTVTDPAATPVPSPTEVEPTPNCQTKDVDCGNGWTTVGCLYRGPDEIADTSVQGTTAVPWTMQLYKWTSDKTTCLYLYRVSPHFCSMDPATPCDPTANPDTCVAAGKGKCFLSCSDGRDKPGQIMACDPTVNPDPCIAAGKGTCDMETLNGVHCYNTQTCDVCAFDYPGNLDVPSAVPPPIKWEQLIPVSTNKTVDCAGCHAPGPITPKYEFYSGVNSVTQPVNQICAAKGGPIWISAPESFVQRNDPLTRVAPPGGCGGPSCHGGGLDAMGMPRGGFVSGAPQFCEFAKAAFHTRSNGAMAADTPPRRFTNLDTCKAFTKSLGCKLENAPFADPFACSCLDTMKNGSETDVDCGGVICPACADGKMCLVNSDCTSENCNGTNVCAP